MVWIDEDCQQGRLPGETVGSPPAGNAAARSHLMLAAHFREQVRKVQRAARPQ